MDTNINVGFMQEDNGNYSSIRLMSFISLLASIVFGYLTIKLPIGQGESGIYITFGFLLAAFFPKVLQKFAEEKIGMYHEVTNVKTEKISG